MKPHDPSHPPKGKASPDRFGEFKTYAKEELIAHLPFTLIGVVAGILLVLMTIAVKSVQFGEEEFHLAHYLHIFFSAAAGSAIFRSYRERLVKAVPVVLVSSILICTLSDSMIPYVGLLVFGKNAGIHICALEHPFIVMVSAALGFVAGFVGIRFFKHCNRPFHLAHILISTAASVLYIVSFVGAIGFADIGIVALIVSAALVVPCLLGDVTIPLFFVNLREEYLHEKVHHSHS